MEAVAQRLDVAGAGSLPVAGIGDDHLRDIRDAGCAQLAASGVDHRLDLPEVRSVDKSWRPSEIEPVA
jgi:hypothetical protein